MGNVQYENDKMQPLHSISYGNHYIFQSQEGHDKIVLKKYHLSEQQVKSFKVLLQKYQQAATHANILPILSAKRKQNCYEIAYKYIPLSLQKLLTSNDFCYEFELSQKNIVRLINQVVISLEALQHNGVPLSIIHASKIFIQKNQFYLGAPLLLCDKKPQHIQQTMEQLQYFSPQKIQTIYDKKDYYSIQKGNVYSLGIIILKLLHRINSKHSNHVKFPSMYENQEPSKLIVFQFLEKMQNFINQCLFYLKPYYSQPLLELIQFMLVKNSKNRHMYENIKVQTQKILTQNVFNSHKNSSMALTRMRGYNEVQSQFLISQICKHEEATNSLKQLRNKRIEDPELTQRQRKQKHNFYTNSEQKHILFELKSDKKQSNGQSHNTIQKRGLRSQNKKTQQVTHVLASSRPVYKKTINFICKK